MKKKNVFLQIGTEEKISEASLGHPRPHHVDHRGARHGKINKSGNQRLVGQVEVMDIVIWI